MKQKWNDLKYASRDYPTCILECAHWQPTFEHLSICQTSGSHCLGGWRHVSASQHGTIVEHLCHCVQLCHIDNTQTETQTQEHTNTKNMVVLVEAQTVATCSEIIVTTIVQQSGSLRAAFQTLMDFVRLLTPSRRVEKIPHGWDNRSSIERKTVVSMKRRMFVF